MAPSSWSPFSLIFWQWCFVLSAVVGFGALLSREHPTVLHSPLRGKELGGTWLVLQQMMVVREKGGFAHGSLEGITKAGLGHLSCSPLPIPQRFLSFRI